MTIAEANAVIAVLRHLLEPNSVIPAERAAADAEYLASRARRVLLAGPDPAQVREWVEAHAERVRVQRDEVERAQAKISEYENTTAWFTTCHGCAGHLDREYAADHRAAKAEAEVERLRAEVKRRDQDAARWRHVEPILTRAQEKGSPYLDVDDLVDAVQDAETGADDGTCDRHNASTQEATP